MCGKEVVVVVAIAFPFPPFGLAGTKEEEEEEGRNRQLQKLPKGTEEKSWIPSFLLLPPPPPCLFIPMFTQQKPKIWLQLLILTLKLGPIRAFLHEHKTVSNLIPRKF